MEVREHKVSRTEGKRKKVKGKKELEDRYFTFAFLLLP